MGLLLIFLATYILLTGALNAASRSEERRRDKARPAKLTSRYYPNGYKAKVISPNIARTHNRTRPK
jgi:hypothetical protein